MPDSMQQCFLARGQLLLMMALGGLAQNVDHEGVQYVLPKNFTSGHNVVDEDSKIEWGQFKEASPIPA